ncbi:hypothetical protein [Mycoplasmopsis verecunda]|uniref:Uncharacterized protein n=1 Tax=Mycoplasmopsis verecunda TaxID=171291 RepID=A0A1T4M5E9_9BACT|nr:hypothetical protein [Mycoplasmopsis verecunda]WPB54363.1 hypothetical protein SAM46_02645 [Mycoplasmopsis verecunda]SJZ62141.1 hypothetical protein SAMN02745154_00630 [Mycoplasmopsis verecunda]
MTKKMRNLAIIFGTLTATSIIAITTGVVISVEKTSKNKNKKISEINQLLSNLKIQKRVRNDTSNLYDMDTFKSVLEDLWDRTKNNYFPPIDLGFINIVIENMVTKNNVFQNGSKNDKIKAWANINITNNIINDLSNPSAGLLIDIVPAQQIDLKDYLSLVNKVTPIDATKHSEFIELAPTLQTINTETETNDFKRDPKNLETILYYLKNSIIKNHPEMQLNMLNTLDLNYLINKPKNVKYDTKWWEAENLFYVNKYKNRNIDKKANFPDFTSGYQIFDNLIRENNQIYSPKKFLDENKEPINPIKDIEMVEVKLPYNTLGEVLNSNIDSDIKKSVSNFVVNALNSYHLNFQIISQDNDERLYNSPIFDDYVSKNSNQKIKFYKIKIPLYADYGKPKLQTIFRKPNTILLNYFPVEYDEHNMYKIQHMDIIERYYEFVKWATPIFEKQAQRVLDSENLDRYQYLEVLKQANDDVFKVKRNIPATINKNQPVKTVEYIVPIFDNGNGLELLVNTRNDFNYLWVDIYNMHKRVLRNFQSSPQSFLSSSNYQLDENNSDILSNNRIVLDEIRRKFGDLSSLSTLNLSTLTDFSDEEYLKYFMSQIKEQNIDINTNLIDWKSIKKYDPPLGNKQDWSK